jgi:hypothetical protein
VPETGTKIRILPLSEQDPKLWSLPLVEDAERCKESCPNKILKPKESARPNARTNLVFTHKIAIQECDKTVNLSGEVRSENREPDFGAVMPYRCVCVFLEGRERGRPHWAEN